jgi:anthranilate phosphoribosyltransferase
MGLEHELDILMKGIALDFEQAANVMRRLLGGEIPPAQVAALLTILKMRGEKAEELAGFASVMRESAVKVAVPAGDPVVDTCGTGGDGLGTFNVSTVAAFVVAGAGVRVAKHGNRAVSSKVGSFDVLEALGIRADLTPERMSECLAQTGLVFLYAPALHPALKHLAPVRRELGFRTVFNLIGPLANPAGVAHQVIGVPQKDLARRMSRALLRLGCERAFLVSGEDGFDEISLCAPTWVFEVTARHSLEMRVTHEDFGLDAARLEDLRGGSAEDNATIARAILAGIGGPRRDLVLANAAAALVVAGKAADWKEGVRLGAESIDSEAAMGKLESVVAFTAGGGEQTGSS